MTQVPASGKAAAPSGVSIRVLGEFAVVRDGIVLPDPALASRRARTLLKLLAVQQGSRVRIEQIIDALWDERRPQRPADNVAVLVSRLRRALGAEVILGARQGYALAGEPVVRLDIAHAERLVAEAESRLVSDEPGLAEVAAFAALNILDAGDVLAGEDVVWAESCRTLATALLMRARHTAADAALRTGDLSAAVSAAGAAMLGDPLDEVAARQCMIAHLRSGEPARALLVYDTLRNSLAAALGTDPAPQTREIHLAVLREDTVEIPGRSRPIPPRASRPDSGFVGRDAEIQQLTAAWARATQGFPSLVLVQGEAGIGKTRLIAELISTAEATGGAVLDARCYETERSLFLQPIIEAIEPAIARRGEADLHTVAGDRASILAPLFPRLTPLVSPSAQQPGTAESERRQTYEAITLLIRRLCEHQPVLLIIDDLQHAGLATVELLHYVARQARGARLLLVAALRSEEGGEAVGQLSDVAQQIELGPLPAPAVRQLVDGAGLAAYAEHIMAGTQGHPLFVVETIRGLRAGDSGIPRSLQEAILARVRRAGVDSERILRAASVLGASFEPHTLGGLLQLSDLEAAHSCEQLLSSRLVSLAGRSYEFAHDLVREVLYATTPEPTRFAYHRVAADLLANQPEAVAAHAAAIGDWRRAGRAWLLAADLAARRYAAADAEGLLNRALEAAYAAEDIELAARVRVARGRVREVLGAYGMAEEDLLTGVRHAREAGDARLEMRALRELGGDVSVALGRPIGDCVRMLHDALSIAESLADRVTKADVLARLAVLATSQLHFDEAVRLGERALSAGRAAGDDGALRIALDGAKSGFAYLGDVERLEPIIAQLEPMLRKVGDMFLLQWTVFEASFIPFGKGDWVRASALVEEALELNRRSGRTTYEGWFHAHLGWIERLQGHHDEAIAHGRRSLRQVGDQPHSWWNTFARAMLATTLVEAGAAKEAAALLEEGLRLADRGGTPAYRLRCLAVLAQITGSRKLLDDADALFASLTVPPNRAWLHGIDAYLAVATAHLDRGDIDYAQRFIAPVADAARASGSMPVLAQTALFRARCAVRLGEAARARTALDEAASLADAHGMRYVAAEAGILREAVS